MIGSSRSYITECTSVPLFLLSKTISVSLTADCLTKLESIPLTSIKCALERLSVPSVVPTIQLAVCKGSFHAVLMCVCVPKYVITIVVFLGLVLLWDNRVLLTSTLFLSFKYMCIF
jgi:hypothetical protein